MSELSDAERMRSLHMTAYVLGMGPKPPALEVYESEYEEPDE